MSIELMVPSNHLILCDPLLSCLQSFPASGSFLMSLPFVLSGQSIRASASASVLLMNIQDWFPLELTGLILLTLKRLLHTTVWKHQFFGTQPSLYILIYYLLKPFFLMFPPPRSVLLSDLWTLRLCTYKNFGEWQKSPLKTKSSIDNTFLTHLAMSPTGKLPQL